MRIGVWLLAAALAGCGAASDLPPAAAAAAPAPIPATGALFNPKASQPAPSEVSLTGSDGTTLRLVSRNERRVVEAPLAFTEVRLAFQNPYNRTLEGNFRITLPQGASISRFAMRIGELWQEGEVIEKGHARAAYEDFLHRKQDPALLEQSAGNEFSARVFPIPAGGTKELVVSYSQELPNDGPATNAGLRSGDLALIRVKPSTTAHPEPLTTATVLVDTSASRAFSLERDVALVQSLAAEVAIDGGPRALFSVIAFDQTQELVFEGPVSTLTPYTFEHLRERGALGASNVEGAIAFAAARARDRGIRRLVLVSDGVATAGETDMSKLRSAIGSLGTSGIDRLDAIAVGGIRDDAGLGLLVRALPHAGTVTDGAEPFVRIARRLAQRTESNVPVRVAGAKWWYPRKLDGVTAGDETLVYAELPETAPVRVTVGETTTTPALATVAKPLLERSWAKAKIRALLEDSSGDREALRTQVVALSTTYRVLSPYTSLLVLEREADYERFHIDRLGTTNILTVQDGRLALVKRGALPAVEDTSPAPLPEESAALPRSPGPPRASALPLPPSGGEDTKEARGNMWGGQIGDAFGAGGLGLGGIGTIGRGAGEGMRGEHRSTAPSIRASSAVAVSGRIPPEIIQRVVRMNFGRLRRCYEEGLRREPQLAGRVSVRFQIGLDGSVVRASDGGSALADPSVIACVAHAFESMTFPRPDGAPITVTYPIVFSPDGSGAATPALTLPTPPSPAPAAPIPPEPVRVSPYTGRFKAIMDLVAGHAAGDAVRAAATWHREAPGDVLALVGLGEAFEAALQPALAARAYGSLIDLFPNRADLRRFAGERLERLRTEPSALPLAIDTYRKAALDRPDHPASHRLLAYALLRHGDHEAAFDAIAKGLAQPYPPGRFAGVDRILREDAGLIAAAWSKAEPKKRDAISSRLTSVGGTVEDAPSLRFVLNWETDANDVDFHVIDAAGSHAYYANPALVNGGQLYADVTTGYGPECFTIRKPKGARSTQYTLQAHYYARGPMGYGMGKLEVIDHDGSGGLTFEERPYVVLVDHAFVDLGTIK